MDTLVLADEAETRTGSTFREIPALLILEGFSALDFQALDGDLEATVRHAVMAAMADAGHVPPFFEGQGGHFGAWAPDPLLDEMGEEARADYYRCLDWALNAAAERFGWPKVEC